MAKTYKCEKILQTHIYTGLKNSEKKLNLKISKRLDSTIRFIGSSSVGARRIRSANVLTTKTTCTISTHIDVLMTAETFCRGGPY